MYNSIKNILYSIVFPITFTALLSFVLSSCTASIISFDIDIAITDSVKLVKQPYYDWESNNIIFLSQYSALNFSHQSAAVFNDYAFFVTHGRTEIRLYSLKRKEFLFSLKLSGANGNTYHCNQSTFGVERYDLNDPFPLLYVSQRNDANGRCFIEGYRIIPRYNIDSREYESFTVDLVQTIYLPAMSYENSLGNANCVIDSSNQLMYTYSRNNRSAEDNYGICKVTQFMIPPVHKSTVYLEDQDITDSFFIDCTAINMQGGCIQDGFLYIGQGIPSSDDLYFNVIDLKNRALTQRFDLKSYKVGWEPEGCFFYDGCVMLAHTAAISRVDK